MTKDLIEPSTIPKPANNEFTIHILEQILTYIEKYKGPVHSTLSFGLETNIVNLIASLKKPISGVPRPSDEEIDRLNGILKPLGIERKF